MRCLLVFLNRISLFGLILLFLSVIIRIGIIHKAGKFEGQASDTDSANATRYSPRSIASHVEVVKEAKKEAKTKRERITYNTPVYWRHL